MGIPQTLSANWEDEVDYRETDPSKCLCDTNGLVIGYKEPETPVSISIRFANVMVHIRNVPVGLGITMMRNMEAIDDGPISRAMNKVSSTASLAFNRTSTRIRKTTKTDSGTSQPVGPELVPKKPPARRGSVALTGLPGLNAELPVGSGHSMRGTLASVSDDKSRISQGNNLTHKIERALAS